jgi:hypothetical protein
MELPDPLPFAGVKVEYVRVPRYRSSFDMAALLESAREELATSEPEQYKIFLLGAMTAYVATRSTSSPGPHSAGTRA